MAKKKLPDHPRAITRDLDFIPYPMVVNDEYFNNGIFKFNITRLNAYIDAHADQFVVVDIDVAYYHNLQERGKFNEDFVQQADLERPVVLAEIAPDRLEMGLGVNPDIYYERGYNLIDGHHRIAKAHLLGIKTVRAYVVRMEQHIYFLAEGYDQYVDYWNGKLKEYK